MEEEKSNATSLIPFNSDERKVDFRLKKLPPIESNGKINYENLLLFSKEVEEREKISREDAHQTFMKNYHSIFEQKPLSSSLSSITEKPQKVSKQLAVKDESHNITEHLSRLHRHRMSPAKDARAEELMKKIRKYSKKPPYERNMKENQQLSKCLRNVDCFSHIPKKILEKLVATAHLEKWDPNFTVFGDSGLYLILNGTCEPIDSHKLNQSPSLSRMESTFSVDFPNESEPSKKISALHIGNHFGRLGSNNDDISCIMSVVTVDECELLRFSNTSFERVTKQIRDEEYGDKLQLAQNCKLFHGWPNLSLRRISEIFHWAQIPPGETLAQEGTVASRICFIKHGICQLKKILSVAFTNKDGKKIRRRKEVVTGNLEPGDSFGEKSLITNEPFEQSVVSETYLIIAMIGIEDIEGLDDVTKTLFHQTCEATGSKTSEANVKKKYIEKQAELEWKSKKESIVRDALYYNGIMPGYSKWSRNPTREDVQHLTDTDIKTFFST